MAVWEDYYKHFNINSQSLRQGCEPKILIRDLPTKKAIILIHGLTDSPFFMEAIGECFYQWGYNVFIPLLAGHGLKHPKYFKGITMETWMENVDFAIQEAQNKYKCEVISIGGLSAGGTISVFKMFNGPSDITGGLFLFSAALDIGSAAGNLIEQLLRIPILLPIIAYLEDKFFKDLVGNHPYKYSRMDSDGARELSKLINCVDKYLQKTQKGEINHPIFVAHCENDLAADIKGVEALVAKSNPDKTSFFRIDKSFHVRHPSVVIKEDIRSQDGSILDAKNPLFNDMMSVVEQFQKQHL